MDSDIVAKLTEALHKQPDSPCILCGSLEISHKSLYWPAHNRWQACYCLCAECAALPVEDLDSEVEHIIQTRPPINVQECN